MIRYCIELNSNREIATSRRALLPSESDHMQAGTKLISEELRQRFCDAKNVLVLTGAGVSAESGVPTFRGGGGATGVWKGLPFDVISSAGVVERALPHACEGLYYCRRPPVWCETNQA